MINTLDSLLTFENIYLIANWGVVPCWLLLMFLPSHGITKFFSHSIFIPLLLSATYVFVARQIYLEGNIFEGFNLYLGLENLNEVYLNESLRLVFWLHFLAISLFVGGWIVKDSQKFYINKILVAIPLIITYLIGPIGLFFYWIIRIFYAKRMNLYE